MMLLLCPCYGIFVGFCGEKCTALQFKQIYEEQSPFRQRLFSHTRWKNFWKKMCTFYRCIFFVFWFVRLAVVTWLYFVFWFVHFAGVTWLDGPNWGLQHYDHPVDQVRGQHLDSQTFSLDPRFSWDHPALFLTCGFICRLNVPHININIYCVPHI